MATDERLEELKLSVQTLDRKLDAVLAGFAHEHPGDRSLRLAEYDDEPVTAEDRAAIERLDSGKAVFVSWDQAMEQLGLEK